MPACLFTIALGIVVLVLGGAGSVRIAGLSGLTVSGGAAAVIIILGLFGVGC